MGAGSLADFVGQLAKPRTVWVMLPAGKVTEEASEADVTIAATAETFEKIARGEQNPTTAYMAGKLKIKGDMGAAMKLQKLF